MAAAFALLAPCLAGPVRGQVAVSVTAQSDYQYRGVTLSDGRPALSLDVGYDHPSGAYAGASVIGVTGPGGNPQVLGYVVYAGWSARLTPALAWDVGVSNARYTEPTSDAYKADDTEVYAGLIAQNVSAHIYYSPNYLGEDAAALYLDVDGTVRLARRWRLFGHVGELAALDGGAGLGGARDYFDIRGGVAFAFRNGEVRLAWSHVGPRPSYDSGYPEARDGMTLGATYGF